MSTNNEEKLLNLANYISSTVEYLEKALNCSEDC